MKSTIEIAIYVCLFVGLYQNWTDFPRPAPRREVSGPLMGIGD
jgi:hypothetical protein